MSRAPPPSFTSFPTASSTTTAAPSTSTRKAPSFASFKALPLPAQSLEHASDDDIEEEDRRARKKRKKEHRSKPSSSSTTIANADESKKPRARENYQSVQAFSRASLLDGEEGVESVGSLLEGYKQYSSVVEGGADVPRRKKPSAVQPIVLDSVGDPDNQRYHGLYSGDVPRFRRLGGMSSRS